MNQTLDKGIHHITVLGGDGQRTTDFYVQTLGLRLIMKTVNQDDPFTYHLFYVNGASHPGSSLTFFPWPNAVQGKPGSGEATAVSFTAPTGSIDFWVEHFGRQDVDFEGPAERFDSQVITFRDPDRLTLELVFDDSAAATPAWSEGPVPAEHGIRGFWGTTLSLTETAATGELLEEVFGFEQARKEGDTTLYRTGNPVGGHVLLNKVQPTSGTTGRGTVHHVAFRAKDSDEQQSMQEAVHRMGLNPTPVIDRHFFRSVYFRSPGGVLFEIATDGPGYGAVQDEESLGRDLWLPTRLESMRETIEKRLPNIRI